jgi:hypothetical protein
VTEVAPLHDRETRRWVPLTAISERELTAPFVLLTLVFKKKRKNWVGKCLELGTATSSDSLAATRRELLELVALHLNAVEEAGERERYFAQRGITVRRKLPPDVSLTVNEDAEGEYSQPFQAQRAA